MSEQPEAEQDTEPETVPEPSRFELTVPKYEFFEQGDKTVLNKGVTDADVERRRLDETR